MSQVPDRVVVDPTAGMSEGVRERPELLLTLSDRTIGFLDISKPRGDLFLDTFQEHLQRRGARILRYVKPTYTRPAPLSLRQEIADHCEAVIEALAD